MSSYLWDQPNEDAWGHRKRYNREDELASKNTERWTYSRVIKQVTATPAGRPMRVARDFAALLNIYWMDSPESRRPKRPQRSNWLHRGVKNVIFVWNVLGAGFQYRWSSLNVHVIIRLISRPKFAHLFLCDKQCRAASKGPCNNFR